MGWVFKVILLLFISSTVYADNNLAAGFCLEKYGYKKENFDSFDFSKVSSCFQNIIASERKEELKELRDFLKHNPRYRYPGQSLNKCFGKPKEMPFEKSTLTVGPNGMEAKVWYKDKIQNCFQAAPWDNREEQ